MMLAHGQGTTINASKLASNLEVSHTTISRYIDLHSLRLKYPITYEFRMDDSIDPEEIFVPPAIFQPLVEYSINHNFSSKEGQGKIVLSCAVNNKQLICTLEDSCSGVKKLVDIQQTREKGRKSFGLDIVRDRLELWSKGKGNKSNLELIPQNEGMRVILGIPI